MTRAPGNYSSRQLRCARLGRVQGWASSRSITQPRCRIYAAGVCICRVETSLALAGRQPLIVTTSAVRHMWLKCARGAYRPPASSYPSSSRSLVTRRGGDVACTLGETPDIASTGGPGSNFSILEQHFCEFCAGGGGGAGGRARTRHCKSKPSVFSNTDTSVLRAEEKCNTLLRKKWSERYIYRERGQERKRRTIAIHDGKSAQQCDVNMNSSFNR